MADRPTGRVRYVPPNRDGQQGYADGVLEDPGNDAVVATFTSPRDADAYGPRIAQALDFEARVAPWLLGVATTEHTHLDGGSYAELAGGWAEEAANLLAGRHATEYVPNPRQAEPRPSPPVIQLRENGEIEILYDGEIHRIQQEADEWTLDTFPFGAQDAIDSQRFPTLAEALAWVVPLEDNQ